MSCYITKIPKPSVRDYHSWRSIGYSGTFEQYKTAKRDDTGMMFLCGDLGEHCVDCADVATILCDYPVGEEKTCDRHICDEHATRIGLDIHYCPDHYSEWKKFKDGGGVEKTLGNIVPFDGA